MAVSVQLRRGTPNETTSFTGQAGEVTVVTPVDGSGNVVSGSASSPWTLRIHDGATAGGHPVIGGSSPVIDTPTINLSSTSSGGTVELQQDYRTRSIKMSLAIGGGDF
tara:strand:- start:240 stop:563 length:324 start_codon:yes stop_codon:yes gene_type:complete